VTAHLVEASSKFLPYDFAMPPDGSNDSTDKLAPLLENEVLFPLGTKPHPLPRILAHEHLVAPYVRPELRERLAPDVRLGGHGGRELGLVRHGRGRTGRDRGGRVALCEGSERCERMNLHGLAGVLLEGYRSVPGMGPRRKEGHARRPRTRPETQCPLTSARARASHVRSARLRAGHAAGGAHGHPRMTRSQGSPRARSGGACSRAGALGRARGVCLCFRSL
jgi:hypothetical protein